MMSMKKLSKKSYKMITIIYDDRIDWVTILPVIVYPEVLRVCAISSSAFLGFIIYLCYM
jgi:hypothetical protein